MSIEEETRQQSFVFAEINSASWREAIYQLLREKARTAWEIAELIERPVYVIRPRITELRKEGKIASVGVRWYEPTHRNEAVWDVVDRGIPF
jgi:hypothetical protein